MDAVYQEYKLVEVYDAVNSLREDFGFYTAELPDTPATVLDIGCGTGTFALELANRGYQVTAVDPASQMISRALQKDTTRSVDWVIGFVSDIADDLIFDVATMTGHAFQCLLDDKQISTLFEAVRKLLDPAGSFWFETRNPSTKPWLRWTPEHAAPPIDLGGGRSVEVIHKVLEASHQYVTFEERYDFNDGGNSLISESTLRFLGLKEIETFASKSGLIISDVFGNWNKEKFIPRSPEIIIRMTRMP